MVRADIAVSIKNAVERGYSIEQAKQSLVNSGYSIKEVDEAINYLTSGVGEIEMPNQANYSPEQKTSEQQNLQQTSNQQIKNQMSQSRAVFDQLNIKQTDQFKIPKQKRSFPWKIIILVILLLILSGVLVGMVLFRDVIIETLQKLLGG
ncbi:hypothetical protein J4477_04455 [Candidatus Pacearchaeota archaeon]|nr:hypothetical protein [Candidatus Pacearchaeota archaeon]